MATIASFGTDLVTQVVMGGQAKSWGGGGMLQKSLFRPFALFFLALTNVVQNWFHKCFLSTYSEHWVTEQSGWNFIVISRH